MRVLVVSTYELGHQPLHLAAAAAVLADAGHDVDTIDVSVDPWDAALLDPADAVAFAVPMHTAMRMALQGAEVIKREHPRLPVCFFGLYAATSAPPGLVDRAIAGEYETELVRWANELSTGTTVDLRRQRSYLPVRSGLPALKRYARLSSAGAERTVGYVEASHGCVHRCRHCPVPVVYDGRTRRVPVETVLDDIAQQVDAGATHITFGDPDFLNRWAHSMQVISELHSRFPALTYDITTKVEHVLRHADLLPELKRTGCLFAVSAYECVNDVVLGYLQKGHTAAEASRATVLLRRHGIEPRPSWLPFTPWTTVEDVADILDFIVEHDLVGNVDPVQLTIRLLIPEGSLMLEIPELAGHLAGYDAGELSYTWTAADPRADALQTMLSSLVERSQGAGKTSPEVFCDVHDVVSDAAGRVRGDREGILARAVEGPRLTEAWFCCAEPTKDQFASFAMTKGNIG